MRFQLTINVKEVDAAVAELRDRGATLLNGPIDAPGASEPRASATRR